MGSTRIFSVIFIISSICFLSTSSLVLPASIQEQLSGSGDELECTKKIINLLSSENSVDIGDFHGKSSLEKMHLIWNETLSVLHNGNNFTLHLEEAFKKFVTGPKLDEFFESISKNSTTELKEKQISGCFLATLFEVTYKITKDSVSKGRLGNTDTLLSMIKDVVTSVDTKEKSLIESPEANLAAGCLLTFSFPDFILTLVTVMSYVPEDKMQQFLVDFPKAVMEFDPTIYQQVIQETFANSI